MNAEGRARHEVGEVEIAGSRRDGIAVERDERPDVPVAKRVGERRNRPGLWCVIVGRECVDWAAKSIVDPQAQRLRGERQRGADEDEAAIGARLQIPGGGGQEFNRSGGKRRPRDGSAEFCRDRGDHRLDRVRMRGDAPVGRGSSQGQGALGRIEPGGGAIAPAAIRQRAGIGDLVRARSEWIGIERDQRIGVAQARPEPQRFSIDRARRFAFGALRRLIDVPAEVGQRFLEIGDLLEQGWRSDAPGEQPEAAAFIRSMF